MVIKNSVETHIALKNVNMCHVGVSNTWIKLMMQYTRDILYDCDNCDLNWWYECHVISIQQFHFLRSGVQTHQTYPCFKSTKETVDQCARSGAGPCGGAPSGLAPFSWPTSIFLDIIYSKRENDMKSNK